MDSVPGRHDPVRFLSRRIPPPPISQRRPRLAGGISHLARVRFCSDMDSMVVEMITCISTESWTRSNADHRARLRRTELGVQLIGSPPVTPLLCLLGLLWRPAGTETSRVPAKVADMVHTAIELAWF